MCHHHLNDRSGSNHHHNSTDNNNNIILTRTITTNIINNNSNGFNNNTFFNKVLKDPIGINRVFSEPIKAFILITTTTISSSNSNIPLLFLFACQNPLTRNGVDQSIRPIIDLLQLPRRNRQIAATDILLYPHYGHYRSIGMLLLLLLLKIKESSLKSSCILSASSNK